MIDKASKMSLIRRRLLDEDFWGAKMHILISKQVCASFIEDNGTFKSTSLVCERYQNSNIK